ncbi:MAG: ATP-binding protein [Candidatus Binataceae bacterium]
MRGERRVVFVAGEAGIGKTTFVRAFLESLRKEGGVRIGQGQCVEQYGASEPYMPMLEALTQLGRGSAGPQMLAVIHRLAPAWLAQLSTLLTAEERLRVHHETQGLTQRRMLREMAEALAALAADVLLVISLEDLHWSDASTLELIAAIARRTEPARLLIFATYRPVEMLAADHPLRALKQELELHGHCEELRLKLLSESDVATYLNQRLSKRELRSPNIAKAIYERTDGNPLFMVNVVDYLVAQGPALEGSKIEAPHNIRQMIERNLERLTAQERTVLETASVAGNEFSAAAVAAALARPLSEVEYCCTRLSRFEQFVRTQGTSEWPDGTVALKARFLHALYRDVLYELIPPGHRGELHRRIAERQETAYGEHVGEIAAELADHYSRANERLKAIRYFQLAGERAMAQSAYGVAIHNSREVLQRLDNIADLSMREQFELSSQVILGNALMATQGYAAPEVESALARARVLCQLVSQSSHLAPIVFGLFMFYLIRGQYDTAQELGEQLLGLAEHERNQAFLLDAHVLLGGASFYRGHLSSARQHLERAITMLGSDSSRPKAPAYAQDRVVLALSWMALTLWMLGYPDRAVQHSERALRLATDPPHPFSHAIALTFDAVLHQLRGEPEIVRQRAQEGLAISTEHEFALFAACDTLLLGWALKEQGRSADALVQLLSGLHQFRESGANQTLPYYLALLAEAHCDGGRFDDGFEAIAEAEKAMQATGERQPEAEIYRVKGVLLLKCGKSDHRDAEQYLLKSMEAARQQNSKSFELRAAINLAELWIAEGRKREAQRLLGTLRSWFTEGFATPQVRKTDELLDICASGDQ